MSDSRVRPDEVPRQVVHRPDRTPAAASQLPLDCLARHRVRPRLTLALGTAVVELVVEAEQSQTPTSGRKIVRLTAISATELGVSSHHRPRFARSVLIRHLLSRYGFRHKRARGEVSSVNVAEAQQKRRRYGSIYAVTTRPTYSTWTRRLCFTMSSRARLFASTALLLSSRTRRE